MRTIQATLIDVPEKDPVPTPTIFLILSYYVGPGIGSPRWRLHRREYGSASEAEMAAAKLNAWDRYPKIVRIG